MEWIRVLPLYDPGEPNYPVAPYQGWFPILEEVDVPIAIRDQVERLATDLSDSSVQPFYRFLWLLNRGAEHKTTHAYLVFPVRTIDRTRGAYCFRSEVLLFPFQVEGSGLRDDLGTVVAMIRSLERRFRFGGNGPDNRTSSVALSAIKLRVGVKPESRFGFAGRIVVDAYGDSKATAVREWRSAIEVLVRTLEEQSPPNGITADRIV